jgi:4-amino-4-deoxy-L-arabinose transferase-like glycosyltransferase
MFAAHGSRSRWIASAFLICASIWFAGLEYRGLFMPDEGRYADIAREMLDADDWVTPRLNGIKYLEKPPLQYWATAGAFSVLGVDEWTARLWPAYTGFMTPHFYEKLRLQGLPGRVLARDARRVIVARR